MLLFAGYFSELVDSRVAATIILPMWSLPLLIALYTFNEQTSQWVYFAVVSLIAGFPYVHPIQVAWASSNAGGVGTRTVSASAYNMFVQASSVIAVGVSRLRTAVVGAHHVSYLPRAVEHLPNRRYGACIPTRASTVPC